MTKRAYIDKIRMLQPNVARFDTRAAKPAPKTADPELNTEAHRTWRANVLLRAGYRCQAIEQGKRCTVAAPSRLFSDHIKERKDGGAALDVANGQCLCGRHHTLKTTAARTARMAERY